jgi:hypothetical protein
MHVYVQYPKDLFTAVGFKLLGCNIHDDSNQTKHAWDW